MNIYRLLPPKAVRGILRLLGDRVATLWNIAQYLCRQRYLKHEGVPPYGRLDDLLKTHATYRALPSDIAQEVLKKVSESWKSFDELQDKYAAGELAKRPSLPGYWKDRKTGHRLGKCIPIKHPRSYSVDTHLLTLTLPADLRNGNGDRLEIPLRGVARWRGKLGRAELIYDRTPRRWYLHVCVEMAEREQLKRPAKQAVADRGARQALAVAIEGEEHVSLFRAYELWRDYLYWSRQISALQSQSAKHGKKSSRALRRLYQHRTDRLEAAYRALARAVVRLLQRHHVTDFTVGDLVGIREEMNFGALNELVHNFWSFAKLLEYLKDACRRAGITIHETNERGTSTYCALCDEPVEVLRSPRDRVRCPYGHQLHADVAGAWNLFCRTPSDVPGRAGGRPRWTTHRWNKHRWVPTKSMRRQPIDATA